MDGDFDIADVHRLVDDVMGGTSSLDISGRTTLSVATKADIPFALNDTKLLKELSDILPIYNIDQADIQVILEVLRDRIVKDSNNESLRDLHALTLNCKRCPALKNPLLPVGNFTDPDVVFVSDQSESDWPDRLSSICIANGIDLSRALLTFSVRCNSNTGRPPSSNERENCSGYLFSELQLLSPKLIIPMGVSVASAFIDPLKISEDHGKIFWTGPWAIMPVYSIGYLFKKESAEQDFNQDIIKANRFLYGVS